MHLYNFIEDSLFQDPVGRFFFAIYLIFSNACIFIFFVLLQLLESMFKDLVWNVPAYEMQPILFSISPLSQPIFIYPHGFPRETNKYTWLLCEFT